MGRLLVGFKDGLDQACFLLPHIPNGFLRANDTSKMAINLKER